MFYGKSLNHQCTGSHSDCTDRIGDLLSIIWSPSLIRGIDQVEKVQRHFTKRLLGMRCLSYGERLQKLDLPRLELRRLHLDLIFCYKIVFGLVCANFNDFFSSLVIP